MYFPLEIFLESGSVLQMRCFKVAVLAAALAMFLPCWSSTVMACSGPPEAKGSKKLVTA
jgi:hypothetical protein